jgi:branched-chain amino acid transport system ATP-binding protein
MAEVLALGQLTTGYGEATVLRAVSLTLEEGRSLAVLGRNGVGKTTLIDSIIGVTRHRGGSVRLFGRDITGLAPEARARAGIGWVPQERGIFRSLTVEENLTSVQRPGPWDVAAVYKLFPRIAERRRNLGSQLSGGEQQMLAIARALLLNPKLLLLDEPTEGLAPILVAELMATIARLTRQEGLSAVIVEQHARKLLTLTDEAIIMERGDIVWSGRSEALATDTALLEAHLGVARRASRASAGRAGRGSAPITGGKPNVPG